MWLKRWESNQTASIFMRKTNTRVTPRGFFKALCPRLYVGCSLRARNEPKWGNKRHAWKSQIGSSVSIWVCLVLRGPFVDEGKPKGKLDGWPSRLSVREASFLLVKGLETATWRSFTSSCCCDNLVDVERGAKILKFQQLSGFGFQPPNHNEQNYVKCVPTRTMLSRQCGNEPRNWPP